MPATSRYILTQPKQKAVTRIWAGLNTKLHLAVDTHVPIRVIITAGPTADCTQAAQLIDGLDAQHLLADRGYDSDAIVSQAEAQGMAAVIPKTEKSYGCTMRKSTN